MIRTASEGLAAAIAVLIVGWGFIRLYDRGLANTMIATGLALMRHGQRLQARREASAASAAEQIRTLQQYPGSLARLARQAQYDNRQQPDRPS